MKFSRCILVGLMIVCGGCFDCFRAGEILILKAPKKSPTHAEQYELYVEAIVMAFEHGKLREKLAEPDIWGRELVVESDDAWTIVRSQGVDVNSGSDDIVIKSGFDGFSVSYCFGGRCFSYDVSY